MNSFGSRSVLRVGSKEYEIYRLRALDENGVSTKHLPYSLRILLENLLRTEDGNVTENDIRALAAWNSKSSQTEIVLHRAAYCCRTYRRARGRRPGGDARRHEAPFCTPTFDQPAATGRAGHDHRADEFGTPQSFQFNVEPPNKERHAFLRRGQTAFRNLAIVPPIPASPTRVNLNTWPAWFSCTSTTASAPPIRTRWSAPIRIPP
jgi:aconitate hydratase